MKAANHRNNFLNGCIWSAPKILQGVASVMVVTYLSFYATDVLGMEPGVIATVLLITKLFDGVTDLIAGFLIDNTHSKMGKARPYDLVLPLVAVFLVLLFTVPKTGQIVQAIYIGVMYVLLQAVFITILAASDSVYLLRSFRDEKQRNTVFSISTVANGVFNSVVTVILPIMVANAGTSQSSWTRMLLIMSIPFAAIGLIRFFTIKETGVRTEETEVKTSAKNTEKKEKVSLKEGIRAIVENRYLLIFTLAIFIIVICSGLLNTSIAYYFKYFVGDQSKMSIANIGAFTMIVMLVLFMPLANKVGKDRLMKVCLCLLCVGNIIRWIGGTNMVTIVVGLALLYIGIVPIATYFPLYIFDIIDYSEWKTGTRVEGVLAVFPNFANKVASGLAVSLGAFILQFAGYNGSLETQSASAMNAINACFNIIPTILCIVLTIIMLVFYNMDKILPTVKKELGERRKNS